MKKIHPSDSNDRQTSHKRSAITTNLAGLAQRILCCGLGVLLFQTTAPVARGEAGDSFAVSAGSGSPSSWAPTINIIERNCALDPLSCVDTKPVSQSGALGDDHGGVVVKATARRGLTGVSMNGNFIGPRLETRVFIPEVRASASSTLHFTGPSGGRALTRFHQRATGSLHTDFGRIADTQPGSATVLDFGNSCTLKYTRTIGVIENHFVMRNSTQHGLEVVENTFLGHLLEDPNIVTNFTAGTDAETEFRHVEFEGEADLALGNGPVGKLDVSGSYLIVLEARAGNNAVDATIDFENSFFDTISWETDGPVFDLPDGWTVNGDGIINNRFFPEPTIVSFDPARGPEGTTVRITGLNFREVTSVEFHGVTTPVASRGTVTINSQDFDTIDAVVPVRATTGPITLRSPFGDGSNATDFVVVPLIKVVASDSDAREAGANTGSFRFDRTGPLDEVRVEYALLGLADNGVDYQRLPNFVVIPAKSASVTVLVRPIDDLVAERTETVILDIDDNDTYASGPNNYFAVVTILDNEPPVVTVSAEGLQTVDESGPRLFQGYFRVSRLGQLDNKLTVNLRTGGSATPGVDYQSLPTSVKFLGGDADLDVSVVPIDDLIDEPDQTVNLEGLPGTGYSVGTPFRATVTIIDNDPPPVLRVGNVSIVEGDSGSQNVIFPITLSGPSEKTITVDAITATAFPIGQPSFFGTAIRGSTCGSGTDFVDTHASFTFAPGVTTRTFSVPVCGDTRIEGNESFFGVLEHAVNATLPIRDVEGFTGFAVATILDNDSKTGSFGVTPSDATVAVGERLNYAFTWTVPEPLNWHDLKFLKLRIRDGHGTVLSVRFDEASNTFSLLNEATGKFEGGFPAGSHHRLRTPEAFLYLADTTVVGSGSTGPSVTLNLSLSFKPEAAGRTFIVEVAASDDQGNRTGFTQAGTLTVKRHKDKNKDDDKKDKEKDSDNTEARLQ